MLSLVPEDIEKYAVNNSEPEGNLLTDLTETTYKRSDAAVMISGPSVGNFLSMFRELSVDPSSIIINSKSLNDWLKTLLMQVFKNFP